MNVTQALQSINNSFRGSDDNPPTTGSDFSYWLETLNRVQNTWATDDRQVWKSLFKYEKPNEPGTVATTATTTLTGTNTFFTDYLVGDTITVSGETVRTIATITSETVLTVTVAFSNTASAKTYTHATIIKTGVQSYSLHRNFHNPSDKAFVINGTNTLEYVIGKPQERIRYTNQAYISSNLPQTLTFYDTINASQIGGTLKVPGYYIPADFTAGTDIVTVDDPYWLIMATSAELAQNENTYTDKSPDLNAKANALWSKMVSNNRRGQNNFPRQAQTNVNRILDPSGESGFSN